MGFRYWSETISAIFSCFLINSPKLHRNCVMAEDHSLQLIAVALSIAVAKNGREVGTPLWGCVWVILYITQLITPH